MGALPLGRAGCMAADHCECQSPPSTPGPPPAVNQYEVEALYNRFRALDKGRKGYITADEFLAIPELSINPLAQRLVRI